MKNTAIKKMTLALSVLALNIGLTIGTIPVKAAETMLSHSQQALPSLAPMLAKVMPSVVSISVEGSTTVNNSRMPPQFQDFFGKRSPFCQEDSPFQDSPFCQRSSPSMKEKFKGLGSGVVINANKGYIVTNYHLVENANKIQVQLDDGRQYNAEVVGKDPRTDIALLQLKNFKNLTAAKMADSDELRVGDYVVAIGNPYGLGETATSGIVSALGRSGLNRENYENFIQTDAAINRGNSGGALVNLNGELVGMNTAILTPDGGNIGIGFAIPSNMLKDLTNQMAKGGEVKRSELGIVGAELNAELAKEMNLNVQKGALVTQVLPKSAAEKAGIKVGDTIVKINDKPLNSFFELRAKIGTLPVGSNVTLGLLRDSKLISLKVILEESVRDKIESENIAGIQGAELSDFSGKGVKVNNVKAGSTAAALGLKKGDIITHVAQQKIKNIAELRKILDKKSHLLILNIERGEEKLLIIIQNK